MQNLISMNLISYMNATLDENQKDDVEPFA